jgi:hypothetical protein
MHLHDRWPVATHDFPHVAASGGTESMESRRLSQLYERRNTYHDRWPIGAKGQHDTHETKQQNKCPHLSFTMAGSPHLSSVGPTGRSDSEMFNPSR